MEPCTELILRATGPISWDRTFCLPGNAHGLSQALHVLDQGQTWKREVDSFIIHVLEPELLP